MANLINSGFGNQQPINVMNNPMSAMPNNNNANMGLNSQNIKAMLQNPQVKQQIRQMYQMFNGDTNALMQSLIQQNPAFKNNPMLQMIMNGRNNPNGILGAMGLSQQDFVDIIKG